MDASATDRTAATSSLSNEGVAMGGGLEQDDDEYSRDSSSSYTSAKRNGSSAKQQPMATKTAEDEDADDIVKGDILVDSGESE